MPVVLGGGVSGLSAAYYLSKKGAKSIQLFEASTRFGGWIKTEDHKINGFRFETGPRTIRPNGAKGKNTLGLLEDLGLSNSVVPISRNHVSAKNRMIYVNKQLCPLPSSLGGLFKQLPPFSKPLISFILNDLKVGRSKVPLNDETIYDFAERRFGEEIAKYAISSMMCGICAGDAKQISVKFLMEDIFNNEQKYGGVIKGTILNMLQGKKEISKEVDSNLAQRSVKENWSIYSLQAGMRQLPATLKEHLLNQSGVELKINSVCEEINFDKDNNQINVRINGVDHKTNYVVSSLPSTKLASLVKRQHPVLANELNGIPYVDVAVVNIQYNEKELFGTPAFGFLVPPSENLPILGVIYDSCCFDMAENTVLTVMMGGAWFKERFGTNPSQKELYDIALEQIGNILNIRKRPTTGRVEVLKNCIPQYVVGHRDRVQRIRNYINSNNLPLSLCGAAYDGVGINDVIYSAKQAVEGIDL